MRITVNEAAKMMDIPAQLLRLALQQDRFPFGQAVKCKRWAYYINRPALERWLEGVKE